MPFFGKKNVLSKSELSGRLMELGQSSNQFTLLNSPQTDFVVERKIVDATGYGIAGVDQLKKSYKAFVLLDEQAHEVRYNEEMAETSKESNISASGISISGEKNFFRGKSLGSKQFGKSWGVGESGKDYSFDVKKTRDPIKKLVEDSGWKFKQVISKEDATYKR